MISNNPDTRAGLGAPQRDIERDIVPGAIFLIESNGFEPGGTCIVLSVKSRRES